MVTTWNYTYLYTLSLPVAIPILMPEAEALLARAPASKPEDAVVAVYGLEIEPVEGRRHRADLMLSPLVERPGWRVVAMHARAATSLIDRNAVGKGDRKSTRLNSSH